MCYLERMIIAERLSAKQLILLRISFATYIIIVPSTQICDRLHVDL